MIAAPPSLGVFHVSATRASPAVAVRLVTFAGRAAADAGVAVAVLESPAAPRAFTARTWNP